MSTTGLAPNPPMQQINQEASFGSIGSVPNAEALDNMLNATIEPPVDHNPISEPLVYQSSNVYRSRGYNDEDQLQHPERTTEDEGLKLAAARPLGSLAMVDGVAVAGVALAPEASYADRNLRGRVLSAIMRNTVLIAQQHQNVLKTEADRRQWLQSDSPQEKEAKKNAIDTKKGKNKKTTEGEWMYDIFGRRIFKQAASAKPKTPDLVAAR